MDEDIEVLESDVQVEELTDGDLDPNDTAEALENQEETESENELPTVSGGDSVVVFADSGADEELLEEIKVLLEANNTMMSEYQQEQQLSIWEKDINDYTPAEGMLLIILTFVVIYFLYKLIGGIVRVFSNDRVK